MEGFNKKDKKFFLFFEFLGTVILTVAFNMAGQGYSLSTPIVASTLFIVSLMSWEISTAHFNSAVTMGALIYAGDLKANLLPFCSLLTMQVFGSFTGIFITWYLSKVVETDSSKTTTPEPPILCPPLSLKNPHTVQTAALVDCQNDSLQGQIIGFELFGSFCYVFTWIVLRNFKIANDYANKKLEAFIKSALVSLLFLGCAGVGLKDTMFSQGTSNGAFTVSGYFGVIANPTLALQTLIWSAGSYDINSERDNQPMTFFNVMYYGRYAWIYILVPFIAAIFSGLLARNHLAAVEAVNKKVSA